MRSASAWKKLGTIAAILGFLIFLNTAVFSDYGLVKVNVLPKSLLPWGRLDPEDIFRQGPFNFLSNFQNPCWKNADNSISCLPYFYLLGVPNVGYRDVFDRIVQHPLISESSAADVHWFSRKRFGTQMPKLSDYINSFQRSTAELMKHENGSGIHNKIFGDCSDSTFWENSRWDELPENADLLEPKYTTADYLYHLNPDAKFIIMIRNPIDRVFSDFMDTYDGDKTDMAEVMNAFHDEVIKMIDVFRTCLLTFPLRHCAYAPCPSPCKIDLTIGMYSVHLSEYLRWYPRTRFLTIKSEDYFKTIKGHLMKIFDFLKVSKPISDADLTTISRRSAEFNVKYGNKGPAPMYKETRKALYDLYKPYNNELGRLLIQRLNYNREEIWWEEETDLPSDP